MTKETATIEILKAVKELDPGSDIDKIGSVLDQFRAAAIKEAFEAWLKWTLKRADPEYNDEATEYFIKENKKEFDQFLNDYNK